MKWLPWSLLQMAGEISNQSATPAPAWMVEFGVYIVRGEARRGYVLAREGVDILKRLTAHEEMLFLPLMSLFITSCLLDEEDAPLQIAQECLELATRIGDPWAIAKAKQLLAVQAIGDADYQRAGQLAHEALQTFDANRDNWSKSGLCTEVLGLLAIRQRQFDAAKQWMQQGQKAVQEIAFKYAIQTAYWQLGFVATLEKIIWKPGSTGVRRWTFQSRSSTGPRSSALVEAVVCNRQYDEWQHHEKGVGLCRFS